MAPNVEKALAREEPLLDYRSAARLLGVTVGTLQHWISGGKYAIPHIRCGRRFIRFRRAALEEWLRARER